MQTKNALDIMQKQNRTIYKDKWNKSVQTQPFSDVHLERVGHMVAIPTQFYTNLSTRDNVCLQYVVKGYGDYFVNDKLYRLQPHTLWLIPKDAYYYYVPDKDNPYEYFWMHCNGAGMQSLLNLLGISEQNPVVYNGTNHQALLAFQELMAHCKNDETAPYLILSKLYALFHTLMDGQGISAPTPAPSNHPDIDVAIAYLKDNFEKDIYLDDLAKTASLEKVYFTKKFKKQTGLSPMQFLIQFRIAHACRLLHTDTSLQDVATRCGFRDFTNFLQRFKSVLGITPTQYRKQLHP